MTVVGFTDELDTERDIYSNSHSVVTAHVSMQNVERFSVVDSRYV